METTTENTLVVTAKELKHLVKLGTDSLTLRGKADPNRPSYSDAFLFDVGASKKVHSRLISSTMTVPGRVGNGNTSKTKEHKEGFDRWVAYSEPFQPTSGFWSLSYVQDRLLAILDLLPKDAEVAFEVALDYGTNEYLTRANATMNYETYQGFHHDHLYLVVYRTVRGERKRSWFLLDTQVVPHNTARFGYGR